MKILIVDDVADAVETLGLLLELEGHEVAKAADGHAALEVLRDFRPDVAFIDISMPRMNGHELARAIRALPWGAAVRLVAVTGWAMPAQRDQALAAGFDHHLAKPAGLDELRALLAR